MEKPTDWLLLWRQIIEEHEKARSNEETQGNDVWFKRAKSYDEKVKARWKSPDSSRSLIMETIRSNPGSTVLDIGAGTGAWACVLAPHAKRVVAVEPSEAMASFLERNVCEQGLRNVEIIREPWPEADADTCDYSLCSHAMCGCPDLRSFIERMEEATRKTCFLIMRVPTRNGLMAEAARRVWGHNHDSPNFQIAYNALLQMGICASVLMDVSGLWPPWTSESIEAALADVKRRLGLIGETVHDEFLRALLERRLTFSGGAYVWPSGVRSALVYWDTAREDAWKN